MWRLGLSNHRSLKITKPLGSGLNARVFMGIQVRDGNQETVAVKLFHKSSLVQSLKNQIEKLRLIQSPRLAGIKDLVSFEGQWALILEFVDGVTLQRLLPTLEASERFELLSQLQSSILELHSFNVVHGDLNLSNVMVDRAGRLRLIDYGLAQETETTSIVGTPRYLSPERWSGEPASRASDFFAVGLMSFDILSNDLSPQNSDGLRTRAFSLSDREGQWFHRDPEMRGCEAVFVESEAVRSKVAKKVQDLLAVSETYRTARVPRAHKMGERRLNHIAALIFCFSFLSPKIVNALSGFSETASLVVRTVAWTEVSLNSQRLGFAPFKRKDLPPGDYLLKWARAGKSGRLPVRLAPGQVLALSDSDFR